MTMQHTTRQETTRIRPSHLFTISMTICLLAVTVAGAVALPQASSDHFLVVFEGDPLPESLDLRYAQGVVRTQPQADDRSRLIAMLPRPSMARDGSFSLQPETRDRQMSEWAIYILPGWTENVLRGVTQQWLREHSLCFEENSGALPGRLTLDRYPPVNVRFEDGLLNSIEVSDQQLLGPEGSGFSIGDESEPLEGISEGAIGVSRMIYEDPEAPQNTLEVATTPTEADRTRFDCTYTVRQPRDESVPVHLTLRPRSRMLDMRGYTWRELGAVEQTTHTLPGGDRAGQEIANLAQTPFVRIESADGAWLGVLDHDQTNVVVSAGGDQAERQFVRISTYLWPRERGHTYTWSFELIGGWTGEYNALLQALAPHTSEFEETYAGAMVDQDRLGDLDASYAQGARVLWYDEWFQRAGAYFDPSRAFDALYQAASGASLSYARLQSDIEAATEAEIAPHLNVQFAAASEDIAGRFTDSIVRDPGGEMIATAEGADLETVWANPDPRGAWGASVLRQVDDLLEATGAAGIALGGTDRLDSAFMLDAYDYNDFNGYSSLLAHGGGRLPVSSVTIAGREWMTQLRAILDRHEAGLIADAPISPRVVRLSDGVRVSAAMTPESLFFMKALSNGKSLYLSDTRTDMASPTDEPFAAQLAQARPFLAQGASFTEPDRLGRLLYAISEGNDYPALWYFDTGVTRMHFDAEARTVPAMYSGSGFEPLDEQTQGAPEGVTIARGGPAASRSLRNEDPGTPAEQFAALPRFGAQVFGAPQTRDEDEDEPARRPEAGESASDEQAADGEARPTSPTRATATEGVPPSYVIGPGDELAVRVWTDRIEHVNASPAVDADGNIYLELAGAVNVAGETISEVRGELRRRFARFFDRAEVTVGLARTRVIEVRVTGDVARPGKYRLSGAVTVFTALHAAGGPGEIGSLRRIRVIRADQPPVEIDLYDYLLQGDPSGDLALGPEDTVFVAPAGPTVGITGEIQRPARYELAPRQGTPTTLPELVQMAGGLAAGAYTRGVQVWRAANGGERQLLNVNLTDPAQEQFALSGGDLVVIPSILEDSLNTMEIAGPVRRPGKYQHRDGMTVGELIRDAQGLTTEAHVEAAYLWRLNEDLDYEVSTIDLRAALHGAPTDDPRVSPGDRLVVLSENDVEAPMLVSVEGAVRNPQDTVWKRGMRVSDLVKQAGGLVEGAYTPQANLMRIGADQRRELISIDLGAAVAGDRRADLELQRGDRLQVLRRAEVAEASEVRVTGLVQEEGWYARPQGMRVSDAILAAGGLAATAGNEIEYTPGGVVGQVEPIYLTLRRQTEGFTVEPDPVIRDDDLIAVLGTGALVSSPPAVTIRGRVDRPGSYALRSTPDDPDTVYDLIQRAGGLLPNANPNGIVLYRLREEIIAAEQEEDLDQMISHFNRELASATVEGEEQRASGTTAQISAGLQTALSDGASTVVIPPRRLSKEQWARAVPIRGETLMNTEGEQEDLPLTEGDVIIVPETPTTVTVMGAVVRSGAVPYEEGLKTGDYIGKVGDFTSDARRDQTVIIRANGEVTPKALRAEIRPGDIILVPSDYIFRDVNKPGTLERVLTAITSIVGGYLIFN
ncbi:MAG: SLBB domain-containing protein [Armatimonadota bacterium]